MIDWCEKCEEMMQPFLDGSLSDAEVEEAEAPSRATAAGARSATASRSASGTTCASRSAEPMSAELKAKLAALRTPLH